MTKTNATWRYAKLTYALVIAVWIGYVLLLFLGKSNDQYHLGTTAVNAIRVSFAVPLLLIWLSAALAAVRFRNYATLIRDSPEALGFRRLSTGLFLLLAYVVALFMFSRLTPLFLGTPFVLVAVFIKNHLPAYLFIASFIELYLGGIQLADVVKAAPTRREILTVTLAYVGFAAVFAALFFSDASTRLTSDGLPPFAVSHTVLLFTLVIPSLIGWLLGILASVYLRAYARKVKGRIYQAFVRRLVFGIYATSVFVILTESLVLNGSRLQNLGLNAALLVVYAVLVAYAIGAIFIARAAAKLTLIEVAS